MIPRRLFPEVTRALAESPAVALLGPRQVGKTTLALRVARSRPAVYLDLESPSHRARLSDPELYLSGHADKLIILDEIQRMPEIFRTLRGLIDAGRQRGRAGASWEGLAIESLLAAAPPETGAHFFRSAAGAEVDLLLQLPGRRRPWAIEIKRGLTPAVERGFHSACVDLKPERRYIAYSGRERFAVGDHIEAAPLSWLCKELRAA